MKTSQNPVTGESKIPITPEFREVLEALGKGWQKPIKMHDRVRHLNSKYSLISKFLPDYIEGGKSVIDISTGNGAFIEIMRHYGNEVMGVEHYYFDYLRSQDLPFVEHDCNKLPYPFKDASYDLVSCIGSITFYDAKWIYVLDEFFRIARRDVFLIVNSGEPRDRMGYKLDNYVKEGWQRVPIDDDAVFHWTRTNV